MASNKFKFYCQKVLPLVYDESLSYYEVLCKLTDYMNTMFETQENYEAALAQLNIQQQNLSNQFIELRQSISADLAEMNETLEKIKNGDYIDLYLDPIKDFIDENVQKLVAQIVSYVSFGLTADGYFSAYIPDSWDFLGFDTIPYGDPLECHLVLNW
jgi:hypothetical protein